MFELKPSKHMSHRFMTFVTAHTNRSVKLSQLTVVIYHNSTKYLNTIHKINRNKCLRITGRLVRLSDSVGNTDDAVCEKYIFFSIELKLHANFTRIHTLIHL